jgi:hypothetical protein
VLQASWQLSGFQSIRQATQIGIVCLRIICRFGGNDLLFLAREFRPQMLGNGFGYLAFDREDVGQFAIKSIGPKMGLINRFNQLHIHTHGIAALLHPSFQNVGNAKLPSNLGQVVRRAFIMLC